MTWALTQAGLLHGRARRVAAVGDLRVMAEEIATAARLEASRVCRLFRRFLGVSPHQYLRRRKMALAAALLLEKGGRVQVVATRVGMDDPFHFSRSFR